MTTLADLEEHLKSLDQTKKYPVESWQPERIGEIDITIDGQGEWHYQGEKMARREVILLFASILRRENDGNYYLVSPVEKLKIQVMDAPLLIVSLTEHSTENGRVLELESNLGDRVLLGSEHPLIWQGTGDQKRPYVQMHRNITAKLSRPVYYELLEYAEESDDGYVLNSGGACFLLS